MKFLKTLPAIAGAAVLLSACTDDATPVTAPDAVQFSVESADRTDRFVILMNRNAIPADLNARVERAGGILLHTIPQIGVAIATSGNASFAEAMESDGRVRSVGPEPLMALPEVAGEAAFDEITFTPSSLAPTPADDLFNAGWVWGVQRVNAPAAWEAGALYTGQGAVIGILDTGVASNHPDLAPNLIFDACFSSRGDVVGRNWQEGDPCNPYPEHSDHGTHVAGTAAAAFGGGRVVGVAPNASLANYNVFELIPGVGVRSYTSSRWRAMVHAADHGVDVINMSLGSFTFIGNQGREVAVRQDGLATFLAAEKRVADYLTQRGTVIVSSAGNAGANLNGPNVASPGQTPGHLTVAATGIRDHWRYQPGVSTDVLADYSNYGAAIDVSAPGGDCGPSGCVAQYLVLSTIVQNLSPSCARTQSCPAWYGWKAGTSMAAPHVAGVAAITRAVTPDLSALQVNSTITRTAETLGDRQQFGHGMVDAAAAAGIR